MAYYPGPGGARSALNVAAATAVKAAQGTVFRVSVIASPSAAGGVFDVATTGGAAAANQVAVIPAAAAVGTVITLDWPCSAGIVVNPGTGGVVAVSYT